MKKLFLLILCAPLYAQHDVAWPHSLCGTYVDTDNPYVIRHYETARRRYIKIPRRPYERFDCTAKEIC